MEGASLKMGGFQRTPAYADGKMIGFTKKITHAEITATLVHTNTTDLDRLNSIEDNTIIFECDSGPVYSIGGAFSMEPPELTADGAGVKVSYAGQPAVPNV